MTILTIFVSALSKQILLTEYDGVEPIAFDKRSTYYDHLRSVRKNVPLKKRTLDLLSEELKIVVYDDLAQFIRNKNVNIGLALYNYHRDVLMRYVETCDEVGIPIKSAVERFYQKYNLSDWDYAQDVAYRTYATFKANRKKSGIFSRTHSVPVTSRTAIAKTRPEYAVFISTAKNIVSGLQQHRQMPPKFHKHLVWYLLYTNAGYSIRKVAAKTGSHRSTVWGGIESIRSWMISDRKVAAAIMKAELPE